MFDQIFNSHNRAPFRVDLYSWQKGVTGSCTLMAITFSDGRKCHGLIDCGIIQDLKSDEVKQNLLLHFDPKIIDFIIITHAHADHIARLPMLYNKGCTAKIYMSHMTDTLLQLALPDAEKIMLCNCKLNNEKKWYEHEDSEKVLENSIGKTYFNSFQVANNVSVMLIDNGHLIGSSSVFIKITDKYAEPIYYYFTGDFKATSKLKSIRGIHFANNMLDLKKIPVNIITEATYGQIGRSEQRNKDIATNKFLIELLSGLKLGKTVFIPTLALERPIFELYEIKKAQEKGWLPKEIPIYVSGKLLVQYLTVCKNYVDIDFMPANVHFIQNVVRKNKKGISSLVEELKVTKEPKIVIASSGMCQYGSAVSILQEYLHNRDVKILFTCYLATGTLGQKIRDSKFGEMISVLGCMIERKAEIAETAQFSGHASPNELINSFKAFGNIKFIGIHHGDEIAKRDLSTSIHRKFPNVRITTLGDGYFFRTNHWGLVSSKPIPESYTL